MTYVKEVVVYLVQQHGTRNPFTIARQKGYDVEYCDFIKIGGMYRKVLGNKFIFINQNLDMLSKSIVCAHELWHGERHDFQELKFLKDHTLLPSFGLAEKEANFFAAELILDESFELSDYFYDDQMPDPAIFNKLAEFKRQVI